MTTLASDYQMMLSSWQQHTQAEFALKDADAALATMTANPYVLFIPTGTGGTGREAVRDFYADLPIKESDRKFFWPLGRRPDDHPGLSDSGL
jgi:hypothetical protein